MSRLSPDKRRLSSEDTGDGTVVFLKRTRMHQRKEEKEAAETALCRLVGVLAPVRLVIQPFLAEEDVARAMRVHRQMTSAVLAGFSFTQHVFTVSSVAQLRQLKAVYEASGLLITRMQTSTEFNSPLVEEDGRSLLPPSLLSLALGVEEAAEVVQCGGVVHAPILLGLDVHQLHELSSGGLDDTTRRSEVDGLLQSFQWPMPRIGGRFDADIPVGCLPNRLQTLRLPAAFTRSLLPGSIPPSVIYVQFDCVHEGQQLAVGQVPGTARDMSPYRPTEEEGRPPEGSVYRMVVIRAGGGIWMSLPLWRKPRPPAPTTA